MASSSSYFHGSNFGLDIGHNSGPISAIFNAPQEAPDETLPSPSSTVPFCRDADFVDRPEILRQIHEMLLKPEARTGLAGLGGVGKSQLAIEISYRLRFQNPSIWVFWIYAGSATRFKQSFEGIATRAGIRGQRDPGANIFKLVEAWLNDKKSGKWMIILDNVDDDRFLRDRPASSQTTQEKPNKPLINYIPRVSHGSVIVTGRNEGAVVKIVGRRNLIQIKYLPESEALELLHKKLILPQDQTETSDLASSKRLVKELGYLPLAIIQAAAFITYFSPLYSVSQYLEKFLTSDHGAIMLLEHEIYEEDSLNRDWEAENSIARTWQISFDHIAQIKPSAAELLSLMCFFDCNEIPVCVLHKPPKSLTEQTGLQSSCKKRSYSEIEDLDQQFAVDIGILRDFAFVTMIRSRSFTMHRLVQLTTQAWLKKQLGRFDFWYTQFVNSLRREFPRRLKTSEDLKKGRVLSPSIFQIYHFALERQQRSMHDKPKMTAGEFHLLAFVRFYETQAREKAVVDFLRCEMSLHARRLRDLMVEIAPNIDTETAELLLHDMQEFIDDNELDITRRLSILAASEEDLDDIETMMKRVDESGQNITLDFTNELASGLEVLKDQVFVHNADYLIGLERKILSFCEGMASQVSQL